MPFDISPRITETLKPSQALRLGCRLSEPCSHRHFQIDPNGRLGACAQGAIFLGLGLDIARARAIADSGYQFLDTEERTFYEAMDGVYGQIMVMNDRGTPREAIADWLEAQGR